MALKINSLTRLHARSLALLAAALLGSNAVAQNASLGEGLSAAAIGRGGVNTVSTGSPLDAMQGNPANLAVISAKTLDLAAVGVFASGRFQNSVNTDGRLSGVSGAMPYGAFAQPLGKWVAAVAVTPDLLMRANWRYVDAPGAAGVTYGLQTNEDEIIAIRSSVGLARPLSSKWSAGVTFGVVYNRNNLNAPYIFQQTPVLAGLKVLLNLQTSGTGFNGSAGVQFHPNSRFQASLAWKSGTTITTHGTADGSASALFTALGVTADPTFHYSSQVENHLPQAFDGGFSWQTYHHISLVAEYDFAAWGQAFQQLPVTLTGGTNGTIDAVAGSSTLHDAVPLSWSNQSAIHVGIESPAGENVTLRAGYSFMTNPVPAATLLPLTAAIMRNSIGTGAGFTHEHWRFDAAYQIQLPSTESVGTSSILAGEYNNSSTRLLLQSVTFDAEARF